MKLGQHLPSGVGVHLTSAELGSLQETVNKRRCLKGRSCLSKQDLAKAETLGFDYAFLSPLSVTSKLSDKTPLGWREFKELAASVSLPVYALGDMNRCDVGTALANAAVGIAGITALSDPK